MKLLFLLALVTLAHAQTSTPTPETTATTGATKQTTTSQPAESPSKPEKEKRTTASETSPQNLDYTFSGDDLAAKYFSQQYAQFQAPKSQQLFYVPQQFYTNNKDQQGGYVTQRTYTEPKREQVAYIPQKVYTEPKNEQQVYASQKANEETKQQQQQQQQQQQPFTTYTIQYVPAQHISHSVGYLPKLQPQLQQPKFQLPPKYQFVSKSQQVPIKASASSQNSIAPQQYFIPAAALHGYTGTQFLTAQQYASPTTTYLQAVPSYTAGHQYVTPVPYQAPAYFVPVHQPSQQYQHQVAAPQQNVPSYSLQPVVMMYTLPGGHYLNTAAGQNALLTFLSGTGSLTHSGSSISSGITSGAKSVYPSTPYVLQRQQLAYLIPPIQSHPSLAQTHPSIAQTHPSIAQAHPSIAQAHPSIAQTHPSIAQTGSQVVQKVPTFTHEAQQPLKQQQQQQQQQQQHIQQAVSSGQDAYRFRKSGSPQLSQAKG